MRLQRRSNELDRMFARQNLYSPIPVSETDNVGIWKSHFVFFICSRHIRQYLNSWTILGAAVVCVRIQSGKNRERGAWKYTSIAKKGWSWDAKTTSQKMNYLFNYKITKHETKVSDHELTLTVWHDGASAWVQMSRGQPWSAVRVRWGRVGKAGRWNDDENVERKCRKT